MWSAVSETMDKRPHISYWLGVWGAVMLALIPPSFSFDFWGRWSFWTVAFLLFATLGIPEISQEVVLVARFKKPIYISIIILFVGIFIANYNLAAPLKIQSEISPNSYAVGAGMGGVHFLPEWTDIRINLENPGDQDYEDAEFTISSSMEIRGVGQISSVPNVEFVGRPHVGEFKQTDTEGHITNVVPAYVPTHETIIRLHSFPKRTVLELILALAQEKPVVNGKAPEPKLYVDHEWPCWTKISGGYSAWRRKRTFKETLNPTGSTTKVPQDESTIVMHQLSCPQGTIAMPKIQETSNGVPNRISFGNPDRQFSFDPVSRVVSFRTKLTARSVDLEAVMKASKEGRHFVVIEWDDAEGARLFVDGMSKEDWNNSDDVVYIGP
jgi:hypothetical protein